MSATFSPEPNPLDLVLERVVEASPEALFDGWTQPELLKKWFAPLPWTTVEAEIELRPGGRMKTVMQSPDGKQFPNEGCVLEVIPARRLTFTSALTRDYRPGDNLFMTVVITFEPHPQGCKYTATAMHANPEVRKQHEEMGFHQGWSQCLDQLVQLVKGQA